MNKVAGVTKCVAAIVLFIFLAYSPNWAQSREETEKELIKTLNEWRKARINGDIAFLEKFYAKELRITGINGSVITREADIAVFASGNLKPKSLQHEDMKVSVYGDAAVATGIDHYKGTYKGVYGEGSYRFTNVLIRRDGRWQLVASQGTSIQKKN